MACSTEFPRQTSVVVIGGGIVGVSAALTLAERGIPVVLLEKGRISAEQSSRNLGWIRKTNRSIHDLPLSFSADRLWSEMAQRVGEDVGYRQAGIMFLAKTDADVETQANWLSSVKGSDLDTRLLSASEVDALVPGGQGSWAGGIFTPSDGRAEPTLATSSMAMAAIRRGAVLVENCAVRTLIRNAGRVSGVVTERGEIRCEAVILAGGLWSRKFLANEGASLPTLPLVASVIRTAPMEGPTDIAVGGPDFSFRKRSDGGYTITQRGALGAPLMLDHLLIGMRYWHMLRDQRSLLRISLGKDFRDDLALPRRWSARRTSPFEKVRVRDPQPDEAINSEAMRNLTAAWPAFAQAVIAETWAGMMDVTPDSLPVIGQAERIPGLTIASGFSGHGFGTGPAAGQLAADIAVNSTPLVDPAPYRLDRF